MQAMRRRAPSTLVARSSLALGVLVLGVMTPGGDVEAAPRQPTRLRKHAATPAQPKKARDASLRFRLVHEASPPPKEEIARDRHGPKCAGEDEDHYPREMTVRTDGRTLRVHMEGGGGVVTVFEGKKLLWEKHVGSAGGADETTACASDGWGVLVAGHYRHGFDVYDLFDGKKRGPGDGRAYSPDLAWGLVPPALSWGGSCFETSRTFRVLTDGSRSPYALDTPPVPKVELCDSPDASSDGRDVPQVAISPDGRLYAIASPIEVGLYRASDDTKIARLEHPRYDAESALEFSRSGRYVVLARDGRYKDSGELDHYEDAEWFRILPKTR